MKLQGQFVGCAMMHMDEDGREDALQQHQPHLITCAWDGVTYMMPIPVASYHESDVDVDTEAASPPVSRFSLNTRVCAFTAGMFSLLAGEPMPCLVYATYDDQLLVYYDTRIHMQPYKHALTHDVTAATGTPATSNQARTDPFWSPLSQHMHPTSHHDTSLLSPISIAASDRSGSTWSVASRHAPAPASGLTSQHMQLLHHWTSSSTTGTGTVTSSVDAAAHDELDATRLASIDRLDMAQLQAYRAQMRARLGSADTTTTATATATATATGTEAQARSKRAAT